MQSSHAVLLQSDPQTAQSLIAPLSGLFECVHQVHSLEESRECIVKNRARVALVDLEVAKLSDVEVLTKDFPELVVVCNHRLADESLWTAALSAGAADCCQSLDRGGILRAVSGASLAKAA